MRFSKKFKNYTLAICSYLRWMYYHNEYQMKIDYIDIIPNDDMPRKVTEAEIEINSAYLTMTIKISRQMQSHWENKDYSEIALIMCHEFSHLLVEPIDKIARKYVSKIEDKYLSEANERQTQRISNIISDRLPKNWYIPSSQYLRPYSKEPWVKKHVRKTKNKKK